MSGQDILPELGKYEAISIRRRVIISAISILISYLATITVLKASIKLVAGENQVVWDQPTLSDPRSAQLVKAITQRGSSYQPESSLISVTAVVSLQNQRAFGTTGVELLLRFLVQYPFVKEVIIWNDDVRMSGVNLNANDLLSGLNSITERRFFPILRVINSPGGMREMSSHMACSLAKFDTCYHADESKLNLNLDTLYTKYLESDGEANTSIIHHASPEEYSAESTYTIFQPGHSLHSGVVSQLSRGSLAPKSLSTRYFRQLSTALLPPLDNKLWSSIATSVSNDIQFSVWSNRRPLKLVASPQSIVLINPNAREVDYLDPDFIHHTYRRLNETIQSSDPFLVPQLFPRALLNPNKSDPEPEIGVASAYDDRSMLITDLDFSYDWPLAVDGELSTCWTPLSNVAQTQAVTHPSFVGLNFVKSVQLKKLTIFGKFDAETWGLEVYSTQERTWHPKRVVPTIIQHPEPPVTKYVYDLTDERNSSPVVKKFRLKSRPLSSPLQPQSSQNVLSVCGWMINEDWVI